MMDSHGIDIHIADEQNDYQVDVSKWHKLALNVLIAQGVKGETELSIIYVDEPTIATLNEKFLGHDGPTDVLSFPIEDLVMPSGRFPDSGGTSPTWDPADDYEAPMLLGDVVICPAVAKRNAPEHAGTYEAELALLLVHGILHILGMDHEQDDEAELMEAREQDMLSRFFKRGDPSGA